MAAVDATGRVVGDVPEIDIGDHPDVVAAFGADPLHFFVDAYQRCGPIARASLGSTEAVVVSGLEANQFVFADADRWDYGSSARVWADEFGVTYLTFLDGDPHRDKRRQMAAGFRASVMAANAPLLAREVARLLDEVAGSTVELRRLAQQLIIRMSGRAVLGRPVPDKLAADIAVVEHHLLSGRALLGLAVADHFDDPTYQRHKASLMAQLEEIINDRSWRAGTAETVLQSLMSGDDGRADATDEVAADLFLLLSAGSETTSAAITWALLFLAADPDWSARLGRDLEDWQLDDGIDVGQYPSLLATVLETERIRPPLPVQLKVAAQDLTFSGTLIPAGTRVLHAAGVTHQLPELFGDPERWRPERFLDGTRDLPARCLGTFGGTSHICLGLPLARLEQMIAAAVVTKGWDVVLEEPPSFEATMSPVLVPAAPVSACFTRK